MSNTVEQLKADFEAFLAEDAKFAAGNGAAELVLAKHFKRLPRVLKLAAMKSQKKRTLAKKPRPNYEQARS